MSDLPSSEFKFAFELRFGDQPPRAVLKDASGGAAALADVELDPTPPYTIAMAFSADRTTGGVKPELTRLAGLPARPFDPALAGDDGVLTIDWHFVKPAPGTTEPAQASLRTVHDRPLETQGKAVLRIFLTNRSNYYEAGDLQITMGAKLPDGTEPGQRPDGNELLSIWPDVQATQTIPANQMRWFDYLVVTRGTQAGLYTLEVHVEYKLFYVHRELCRTTEAVAHLPLHVQGGSTPPIPGGLRPLPATQHPQLERISPHRRLHMSEHDDRGHSSKRSLQPIERKMPLPGGGELNIQYRLVKGSNTRPDESRPRYGWNPDTKEAESYFSTADEAAMEITIHNRSGFHLKHIYLSDVIVSLFQQFPDGSKGAAFVERLPDGNFQFEVLPNEVYFGSLQPDDRRTRYLGLVTRGVRAGDFFIQFDVCYEIVDGKATLSLPITVKPD